MEKKTLKEGILFTQKYSQTKNKWEKIFFSLTRENFIAHKKLPDHHSTTSVDSNKVKKSKIQGYTTKSIMAVNEIQFPDFEKKFGNCGKFGITLFFEGEDDGYLNLCAESKDLQMEWIKEIQDVIGFGGFDDKKEEEEEEEGESNNVKVIFHKKKIRSMDKSSARKFKVTKKISIGRKTEMFENDDNDEKDDPASNAKRSFDNRASKRFAVTNMDKESLENMRASLEESSGDVEYSKVNLNSKPKTILSGEEKRMIERKKRRERIKNSSLSFVERRKKKSVEKKRETKASESLKDVIDIILESEISYPLNSKKFFPEKVYKMYLKLKMNGKLSKIKACYDNLDFNSRLYFPRNKVIYSGYVRKISSRKGKPEKIVLIITKSLRIVEFPIPSYDDSKSKNKFDREGPALIPHEKEKHEENLVLGLHYFGGEGRVKKKTDESNTGENSNAFEEDEDNEEEKEENSVFSKYENFNGVKNLECLLVNHKSEEQLNYIGIVYSDSGKKKKRNKYKCDRLYDFCEAENKRVFISCLRYEMKKKTKNMKKTTLRILNVKNLYFYVGFGSSESLMKISNLIKNERKENRKDHTKYFKMGGNSDLKDDPHAMPLLPSKREIENAKNRRKDMNANSNNSGGFGLLSGTDKNIGSFLTKKGLGFESVSENEFGSVGSGYMMSKNNMGNLDGETLVCTTGLDYMKVTKYSENIFNEVFEGRSNEKEIFYSKNVNQVLMGKKDEKNLIEIVVILSENNIYIVDFMVDVGFSLLQKIDPNRSSVIFVEKKEESEEDIFFDHDRNKKGEDTWAEDLVYIENQEGEKDILLQFNSKNERNEFLDVLRKVFLSIDKRKETDSKILYEKLLESNKEDLQNKTKKKKDNRLTNDEVKQLLLNSMEDEDSVKIEHILNKYNYKLSNYRDLIAKARDLIEEIKKRTDFYQEWYEAYYNTDLVKMDSILSIYPNNIFKQLKSIKEWRKQIKENYNKITNQKIIRHLLNDLLVFDKINEIGEIVEKFSNIKEFAIFFMEIKFQIEKKIQKVTYLKRIDLFGEEKDLDGLYLLKRNSNLIKKKKFTNEHKINKYLKEIKARKN